MRRFIPLLSSCVFILLIALVSVFSPFPLFIYNTTDSLPHGIYLVVPREYRYGDLVVFRVPDDVRSLVHERQWLPDDGFLMKRVAALPGDRVCTAGGRFVIDESDYGLVLDKDSMGRPMPRFDFCGILEEGVVVALAGSGNSFDSRYYGPLPVDAIIGVAFPLVLGDCF